MIKLKNPSIVATLTDSDLSLINNELLESLDVFELRVDLFQSTNPDYIREVLKKAKCYNKPLLLTIRHKDEGGRFEHPEDQRLFLYKEMIPLVDALDVEINSVIAPDLIAFAHLKDKMVVGSFHDFKKTPSVEEMEGIYRSGKAIGADIVKIATMADDRDALKRAALLTIQKGSNADIATLCMGRMAYVSRIFLPFLGSVLTYGAVGKPKAPGQINVVDLRAYIMMVQG